MQVIRGVGSPGFTSRYLSLRHLGAAAELWASNPREARPEGCVAEAAHGRGGWVQRVREPRAPAAGGVWCPPVRLRPGRDPGWVFYVWGPVGGGALAVLQWQPGCPRLLTLALRCSRSWLPAGALTPRAPPGAALAPGAPAAGQQVAAASLPPKLPNAA